MMLFSLSSRHSEDALLVSLVTENGIKPAKFSLQQKKLEILFDSVPDFQCVYMSLDDKDQLYFSDKKQIYTLGNQESVEQVWRTSKGDITGFTLVEGGFVVGLAHSQKFELLQVSHDQSEPVSLLNHHFDKGVHFTSTSRDASNYLFSKVKDIKKLVRLR